ncbi:MAG: zf-HC2 domain-containing protein [Thiobacillus sp.]
MKWLVTCKQNTELASRAMDEGLSYSERVTMQLHLLICNNCARLNQHLQMMRTLFRQETESSDVSPGLAPAARQRIKTELQNKLDS